MSTPILGLWNFGDISWLGPATNPALFAAITKEKDGSFSNFIRLIPESVDDYNLPANTIAVAKALTITPSDKYPAGMNFYPGGIGYSVTELTSRCAIYRTYHGGAYPPWSPAPTPKPTVASKLKAWMKVLWS